MRNGIAEGVLVGGCLESLQHLWRNPLLAELRELHSRYRNLRRRTSSSPRGRYAHGLKETSVKRGKAMRVLANRETALPRYLG